MKIELTPRQIAIVAATVRRCEGWDTPSELQRFVNTAAEHVRNGWREDEMTDILETLAGQYQDGDDPLRAALTDPPSDHPDPLHRRIERECWKQHPHDFQVCTEPACVLLKRLAPLAGLGVTTTCLSYGDCVSCDGYVLNQNEAPHCPTCARLLREGKTR